MHYLVISESDNPQDLNFILGKTFTSKDFYTDVEFEIITNINITFDCNADDVVYILGENAYRQSYLPDLETTYKDLITTSIWENGIRIVMLPDLYQCINIPADNLTFYHTIRHCINHAVMGPPNEDIEIVEVGTPVEIDVMITDLMQFDHIVLDIETTGLSYLTDDILCIALSGDTDRAYIVKPQAFADSMFQAFLASTDFICHNGKFDAQFILYQLEVLITIKHDTMILSYCFDERGKVHGLKHLVKAVLGGSDYESIIQPYLPNKNSSYSLIPTDILYKYAGLDVSLTLQLYRLLKRDLIKQKSVIKLYHLIRDVTNVFIEMEMVGLLIDRDKLEFIKVDLSERLKTLEAELIAIAESFGVEDINIRSPKQIKDFLYTTLRLTGSNNNTTNAEVLEELQTLYPENDFLTLLLDYRKVKKMLSTYVIGLEKHIDPDGRVRTSLNSTFVVTGRLSSSNPNLQNIPKPEKNAYSTVIRSMYIADEGYSLIDCDYSQIQLRIAAVLSKETAMSDVWVKGGDLHSETSIRLFGNADKDNRNMSKGLNFGLIFGITAKAIAKKFGLSVEYASEIRDKFFLDNPKLELWLDRTTKEAHRKFKLTTMSGRSRRFGYHKPDELWKITNMAVNYPIQSLEGDIILTAIVDLHAELKSTGLGKLVLTVHDDIKALCEDKHAKAVADLMVEVMSKAAIKVLKTDFVPFDVDADIEKCWK